MSPLGLQSPGFASETVKGRQKLQSLNSYRESDYRMLALLKRLTRDRNISRWMLAFMLTVCPTPSQGVRSNEPMNVDGSSSRESRQRALQSVPLASLTPQAVAKLRPVLDNPTIFRRMPMQSIACDADMFTFAVRYPEVLVEIWQLMGMTKVTTERTGPFSFRGDDGTGTTCRCELVFGSEKLHVYYTQGDYEGGIINRKLDGRCVCVIHSQQALGENGQPVVSATMDVFLKLDNVGADLIAKTISPLVVKTADYNCMESLRFISQLSTTAQRNPEAIEQLAAKLDGLHPDVRNRFIQVAHQSAIRRDRLISERSQRAIQSVKEPLVIIGQATSSKNLHEELLSPIPVGGSTSADDSTPRILEHVVR